MKKKINPLVVGDLLDREFHEALARMRETGTIFSASTLSEAIETLQTDAAQIDLIVIAVSHPWQFAPQEIARLQAFSPIHPLIALMGSWCEGHHRTEASWRNVPSVYWHEWPKFWDRELRRLDKSSPVLWSLPATASREEIFSTALRPPHASRNQTSGTQAPENQTPGSRKSDSSPPENSSPRHETSTAPPRGPLIALCGMPYETADALAEVVSTGGYASVWLPQAEEGVRLQGVGAILWEGIAADDWEIEQLQHFRARLSHPPTLALLDFPRVDSVAALRTAGAQMVLGKPLLNPDLLEGLATLTQPTAFPKQSAPSGQREAA